MNFINNEWKKNHILSSNKKFFLYEYKNKMSLKFLKNVGTNLNKWIMCYPYGSYNKDTLNILRKNKCSIGLTTKVGIANLYKHKILELNRLNTNDFPQ